MNRIGSFDELSVLGPLQNSPHSASSSPAGWKPDLVESPPPISQEALLAMITPVQESSHPLTTERVQPTRSLVPPLRDITPRSQQGSSNSGMGRGRTHSIESGTRSATPMPHTRQQTGSRLLEDEKTLLIKNIEKLITETSALSFTKEHTIVTENIQKEFNKTLENPNNKSLENIRLRLELYSRLISYEKVIGEFTAVSSELEKSRASESKEWQSQYDKIKERVQPFELLKIAYLDQKGLPRTPSPQELNAIKKLYEQLLAELRCLKELGGLSPLKEASVVFTMLGESPKNDLDQKKQIQLQNLTRKLKRLLPAQNGIIKSVEYLESILKTWKASLISKENLSCYDERLLDVTKEEWKKLRQHLLPFMQIGLLRGCSPDQLDHAFYFALVPFLKEIAIKKWKSQKISDPTREDVARIVTSFSESGLIASFDPSYTKVSEEMAGQLEQILMIGIWHACL